MKKISEKEYDILESNILDALQDDSEFPGELATGELLERISGHKVVCYDHYIDDGCGEDEEDEYIMCAAYEIKDTDVYVRVYYGDNTGLIGYIEVTLR